jgi:hypothetical protein
VRLSVVIPALNEERHLGQLLSDIRRQGLRPEEVIVVDAGSRDRPHRRASLVHGGRPRRAARRAWQEPRRLQRERGPDLLPRRQHPTASELLRGFRRRVRTQGPGHRLPALPPLRLHARDKGYPRLLEHGSKGLRKDAPLRSRALYRAEEQAVPGE